MSASDPTIIDDLFKFRRFRLNVLGFLRLPLDTHEEALRRAIEASSARLLADYLHRAERVRQSVVAKVAAPVAAPADAATAGTARPAMADGEAEHAASTLGGVS